MRYATVPEVLRSHPFTRATAHANGVSDAALQSAPWRQVFRGVWAHASLPDTRELRLAAAALLLPTGAVLCGVTAAWIYGADVRRSDDLDIHVSFPRGRRRRDRPGVVVSQETLRAADVCCIGGIAVTSPTRTAYDCLRLLPRAQAIVVADALTHLRRTTVDALREYFDQQYRMRNLRIGRARLDEVEPLSESPMESRLRVGIVDAGLPRPSAQHVVCDGSGAFVARVDLAYADLKIAIEYDGAWHWEQRRDDDRRRDRLRALGWQVLVYSSDDVFRNSERIAAEIRAARRRQPR